MSREERSNNKRYILRIIALTAVVVLTVVNNPLLNIVINFNEVANKSDIFPPKSATRTRRTDRFMTVHCDKAGRLGNKMSQYATLLVNAEYYNVSYSRFRLVETPWELSKAALITGLLLYPKYSNLVQITNWDH